MKLSYHAKKLHDFLSSRGGKMCLSIRFICDLTQPGTMGSLRAAIFELQGKGLLHVQTQHGKKSTYTLLRNDMV